MQSSAVTDYMSADIENQLILNVFSIACIFQVKQQMKKRKKGVKTYVET